MVNLKGSTGGSLGGGIISVRARGPVLEKNTETCKVCWSGKGYPCQTKSGADMKLTHASLAAGKTEAPKRAARKSPAKKSSSTAASKRSKRPAAAAGKENAAAQLPGEKVWDDEWPETWGGKV